LEINDKKLTLRTVKNKITLIYFCLRNEKSSVFINIKSNEINISPFNEILKLKGYDHIFVNSVCPLERTKHIDVACKNFYKIDQHGHAFWEYAVTKYGDSERRQYNHFTPVPHESFGKELVDYIVTNII
jgi:hypothetical protein